MNDFLDLKHNWSDVFTIGYSYLTPIATAINTSEQRGSLRNYPLRTLSYEIFESYDNIAKIRNNIKYNYGLDFVPVLSEPFICDNTEDDLQGLEDLAITTAINLFSLWMMRIIGDSNGIYGNLLMIDKAGLVDSEKLKVTSFYDEIEGLHVVVDPIVSSLSPARALFYPLIYCALSDYEESHLTNEKGTLSLSFSEQYNKE